MKNKKYFFILCLFIINSCQDSQKVSEKEKIFKNTTISSSSNNDKSILSNTSKNEPAYYENLSFIGDSTLLEKIKKYKRHEEFRMKIGAVVQEAGIYFLKKDSVILVYKTANESTKRTRTVITKLARLKPIDSSDIGSSEMGVDENGVAYTTVSYYYDEANYGIGIGIESEHEKYLDISMYFNNSNSSIPDSSKELPLCTLKTLVNIKYLKK